MKKIQVIYNVPRENLDVNQVGYIDAYIEFYTALVNDDMRGLKGMNVLNEALNRMKARYKDHLPKCDFDVSTSTMTVDLRKQETLPQP